MNERADPVRWNVDFSPQPPDRQALTFAFCLEWYIEFDHWHDVQSVHDISDGISRW